MYTAQKAAEAREFEMQRSSDAKQYETKKSADAALYKSQKSAEARQFEKQKDADASQYAAAKVAEADYVSKVRAAEAELVAAQKKAEAMFITRKREAEGLVEMAKGYAALASVMGGPEGLMQFLMIERGVYGELANANAKAIQGLQPKITVWNTGSNGGEAGMADPTAPIRNIFQALPPLFSTINDQTGISPPAWMAQMPGADGKQASLNRSTETAVVKGKSAQ